VALGRGYAINPLFPDPKECLDLIFLYSWLVISNEKHQHPRPCHSDDLGAKQRTIRSPFQKVSILASYLPAILLFGGSKFWQEILGLRRGQKPPQTYWTFASLASSL